MEKTTINTYLYCGESASSLSKLIDITSYPDLISPPEKLDVSDLSSKQKKYVEGMVDLPDYEFGANYTKAGYQKVDNLKGKQLYCELRFGENSEYGKFSWQGTVFPSISGGDVGGKREMKITCYPETDITFSAGASS